MESEIRVQQEEFEKAARSFSLLKQLDGKYVFLTGATGLIGTQIAKTLLCYNRLFGSNIHVIVCGRSEEKLGTIYGALPVKRIISDVLYPMKTELPVDYIIHCANATSSQFFVENPVDTIQTAINGTTNMLELAKEKKVKGFLFTSSLEVYGVPEKQNVKETDYGFIDFLNVRSSYSESKRMAECLCKAYSLQYGVPIKIARLTQTIGSGVDYHDNRVFAQFARSVIEKKDIILNTAGRTVRSYCDITDAVKGILTVLIKGQVGEAYNIANKDTTISIAEMAQFVCDHFKDSGIKVVFNSPQNVEKLGYNPEMQISLNTEKLEALGWKAEVGLEEIFRKLIEGLRKNLASD